MTKIRQDFSFWTGEDKNLIYTITDGSGASINLTGYSASWLLFDDPSTGSILSYYTGSGISISGCTFTVALTASDTSGCTLAGIDYYSELSACDGSDNVAVLATGTVSIRRRGY